MNKRERTLLIAMIAVVAGGAAAKMVYPRLIKPVFDLSGRIEAKEREKAKLQDELYAFDADIGKYREYVLRTGGTDADSVKEELYDRIDELIQASTLGRDRVSPKKPTTDRKTRLQAVRFSVNAEGTWKNVIQFIQRFYELPYVAQFTDIKLTPLKGRGRKKGDRVKVSGSIEVYVLPGDRATGEINVPADAADRVRVKYTLAQSNVAELLEWQPFQEYVKPPPPPKPKPKPPEPEKEPEDTGPKYNLDPNRTRKFVRQIWSFGRDEVLVCDQKNNDSEWVGDGGQLDGGEIILVHPLGLVVRRPDRERFFYPLGKRLSECLPLEEALELFPEVRVAMRVLAASEKSSKTPSTGPAADATTGGLAADATTSGLAADVGSNGDAGTSGLAIDAGTTGPVVDLGTSGIAADAGSNGAAGTNGVAGGVGQQTGDAKNATTTGPSDAADASEPEDAPVANGPDADEQRRREAKRGDRR